MMSLTIWLCVIAASSVGGGAFGADDTLDDVVKFENLTNLEYTCTGSSTAANNIITHGTLMLNSSPLNFNCTNPIGIVVALTEVALNQSLLINVPPSVKYLKFRSESITDILPRFPIDGANNLSHLDLTSNAWKTIPSDAFRTLPRLQVLNLSVNSLESIGTDGFAGLGQLKCLDLSSNNLHTLQETVFKPLDSLQHLNLSRNRLQVLANCFATLVSLQQLDLSSNRLSQLGSVELPSLARLLVSGNPDLGTSRKEHLFVTTGRRLQTVDASRIGLKQVPAALTHSIRTLHLAGNAITLINRGDLDSYPLLQLLDFTSNGLGEVEEDALGRLESLTILYLTDNRLRAIPHSLPERLKVLHLERNRITGLRRGDLDGLPQLEVLLLSGNLITSVGDTSFAQMGSLVSLDLSRNPLKELPAGVLAGPVGLRVLRLSGLVTAPPAKDLAFPLPSTEHLISLDLSASPGMARQMLADNAALAAARELQELNLASSGLNYVRSDLLHYLPQLRALHLGDNPLNCTGLQWLGEWMRAQDQPEYRRVTCASPPELWATLLIDLQEDADDPITTPAPSAKKSGHKATASNAISNKVTYSEIVSNEATFGEAGSSKPKSGTAKVVRQYVERMSLGTSPDVRGVYTRSNGHESGHILPQTNVMNILQRSVAIDGKKINRILKEPRDEFASSSSSLAASNLFMKKSLRTDVNSNDSNRDDEDEREASLMAKRTNDGATVSMYKDVRSVHTGMYVLAVAILTAAFVLVVLTARIRRRNRLQEQRQLHEDEVIEVGNLADVTELW